MFHAADGTVVQSSSHDLTPGHSTSLVFVPTAGAAAVDGMMEPCIMPDPAGGAGIPSAEVFDTDTHRTTLFINPAAAAVSSFDQ